MGIIAIDTVLLKVASRCNLDCGYCYVYHMGDDGWRSQPKRMSRSVIEAAALRFGELYAAQSKPFSVVFHGGEPLLLGAERFAEACRLIRGNLPRKCSLHLQTNGLLLSREVVDICAEYEVGISVSLDGPAQVHDRNRPDKAGRGSHARVVEAIARLLAHPAGKSLLTGVLAVVDLRSEPEEVYAALKATGAPSIDFLYRDGNRDTLPLGKASLVSTEYGGWMCRLLDAYLSDVSPVPVRVLDDMLRLLLGGASRKEGVGIDAYGILVVDTDGSVNKNDTLKGAFGRADRFDMGWSVLSHDLRKVVASTEFAAYHRAQRPSCATCQSCESLRVCGGGMPAHRWSKDGGFDNPSVFCVDQRMLIERMRHHLARNRLAA